MPKATRTFQDEIQQEIVVGDTSLKIVACRLVEGEWELYVENEFGVRSVWFECFASAEAALEAAGQAIETEGIEAFLDIEDFGYLLDDKTLE